MDTLDLGRAKRRDMLRLALIAIVAALAIVVTTTTTADAAVVSKQWLSKLGSAGANGTATAKVFTTGTGSLAIALKRLARSTTYSETVYRGTCARRTTRLFTLPNFRTSSTGTINRTNNLTASQARSLSVAPFVIRFVAGTRVLCGSFAAVRLAVAPTPTPTPTSTPSTSPSASPSATLVPAPTIAATVPVGLFPVGIAVNGGTVWVTNFLDQNLSRIDIATNQATRVTPIVLEGPAGPWAIDAFENTMWLTIATLEAGGWGPGMAVPMDPMTGNGSGLIPVGRLPSAIAIGGGAVWVAANVDRSLQRIDPGTRQVVATIPLPAAPTGVTFGSGAVWTVTERGTVNRIDPATNQIVATVQVEQTGASLAFGEGSLWVTSPGSSILANGRVTRIDPATNLAIASIPVGNGPAEIAVAGGFVWIGMMGESSVVQVDPRTNAVANRVATSAPVWDIAATDHSVWALHNPPFPEAGPPPPGSVTRLNF